MRGKVEQIYLKYFDAAKMRGKVGTLIRDKMNRLHVLHYYRLKEHHESWKVKFWKERQIFFHFPDQRIDSKYLEFNIFRLWLHFFDTRGCLRRKCVKQILLRLSRRIFWVQWWPSQTPPLPFSPFSPHFLPGWYNLVSLYVNFHIFGESKKLHTKFFICWMKISREVILQTWLLCDCFKTRKSTTLT